MKSRTPSMRPAALSIGPAPSYSTTFAPASPLTPTYTRSVLSTVPSAGAKISTPGPRTSDALPSAARSAAVRAGATTTVSGEGAAARIVSAVTPAAIGAEAAPGGGPPKGRTPGDEAGRGGERERGGIGRLPQRHRGELELHRLAADAEWALPPPGGLALFRELTPFGRLAPLGGLTLLGRTRPERDDAEVHPRRRPAGRLDELNVVAHQPVD